MWGLEIMFDIYLNAKIIALFEEVLSVFTHDI